MQHITTLTHLYKTRTINHLRLQRGVVVSVRNLGIREMTRLRGWRHTSKSTISATKTCIWVNRYVLHALQTHYKHIVV
jgi:hypothetical protein